MTIDERVRELGLVLPEPFRSPTGAAYPFSWVRVRSNRAYVSGHLPLQPDDADKAGTALAVVIGPIGKVLARRCAEGAGTRERFVSRVLEQLTARVDAKQVEAILWRSMI